MKLEELIAKIAQIEEQATLTLSEYPRGLTVERLRLIMGLSKQVRAHLEDQVRVGPRQAESGESPLYAVRPNQQREA